MRGALKLPFSIMRGLFITLEGIDGCGKSTQLEMLATALVNQGLDVALTREPGGTPIGERIRSLLSSAGTQLDAKAELFLLAASRAQLVAEVIKPALESGRIMISDRYTDSTVVFQGYGRELDLAMIKEVNQFATGGLAPDLTIFFDIEVAIARARLDARRADAPVTAPDPGMTYLDEEEITFHERVRHGYLKLAASEPARIITVDAAGSIQQLHAKVLSLVLTLIGRTEL